MNRSRGRGEAYDLSQIAAQAQEQSIAAGGAAFDLAALKKGNDCIVAIKAGGGVVMVEAPQGKMPLPVLGAVFITTTGEERKEVCFTAETAIHVIALLGGWLASLSQQGAAPPAPLAYGSPDGDTNDTPTDTAVHATDTQEVQA